MLLPPTGGGSPKAPVKKPTTKTKTTSPKSKKGSGKTSSGKYISNPRPDHRLSTSPGIHGHLGVTTGIDKGFIVRQDKSYVCQFMYNPSTLDVSSGLDTSGASAILPQSMRNSADTGRFIGPLSTELSFSLLFDRTFELWDSSIKGKTAAGKYGVAEDILALYNITGQSIAGDLYGAPYGVIQAATNQANFALINPMQMFPVYVYFGAHGSPTALYYYGYIDSLDVTYSHWAQDMTPYRAAVDVGITLLPQNAINAVPTTTDTSGGIPPSGEPRGKGGKGASGRLQHGQTIPSYTPGTSINPTTSSFPTIPGFP